MVMGALWLALALAGAADTPAQPVTVEIVTVGKVETPGQRFVLPVALTVTAPTQKQADAALAERKQALIAKIQAAGGTIAPSDAKSRFGLPLTTFDIAGPADTSSPKRAGADIVVTVSDPAAARRIRDAVDATEGAAITVPEVSLLDPAPARSAAIAAGMKQAREEANAYAATLGLPKVTMISISEKSDLGSLMMMTEGGGRALPGFGRASDGDTVVTLVPIIVTYRLER